MSLKNKILAICPLLSVVLFLVLGFADDFGFQIAHYGIQDGLFFC
jgi:hypothetical protein